MFIFLTSMHSLTKIPHYLFQPSIECYIKSNNPNNIDIQPYQGYSSAI